MTVSRFQRLQNTIIVAALVAPLLSFIAAPAHAVAPTCAQGGVCQVGDIGPGGGKVFYVAETTFTQIGASGTMCTTNCKYLEAAPNTWSGGSADPLITWATDINSNQTTAVTGADGTAIGTGYKNSLDIVAQAGNVADSSAAVAARGYRPTVSGTTYTDWFLPSKDELNALYAQKLSVGVFQVTGYWSSSEIAADVAWLQDFNDGYQVNYRTKFFAYYVRPVRAFAPAVATQISITRAAVGTQRRTAFTTQPQITIQFSNNETVTASSAVVTASISSGGTLVGTTTATASSGVATFSNLGVDGTVGTQYTITYTALDLPVASATVTLTGTTCNGTTFTCQVGDTGPGGGVIFYEAPNNGTFTQIGASGTMCTTNCKYLEVAPNTWNGGSSDPSITWATDINSNQTTAVTGADGTAIGTGYKNSLDIVAQAGNVADSSAAVAARGYRPTVSGTTYTDWYLPSKDELNALYLQKTTVGGFVVDNYWSSSEYPADKAWLQYFANGSQDYDFKDYSLYVRPIRAFGTVPTSISVYAIGGVTAPVSGATPVSTVTAANGYTGTVTWSGSPTTFASSTIYTATITLTAAAGYTLAGVGANSYTVAGATLVTHSLDSGIVTAAFPATAAPTAAPVVYVAPTPVPYLKTLTTPKLNLKDGKLICTPGTYNAGYTLNGVIQGSATALFTPNTFTYNLLIDGVAQTLLAVTSSTSSHSWNMPTGSAGALLTCSVTVTANGLTNTDRSGDNASTISSALSTQAASIATANADYSALLSANSKAYQKALTDNRTKWRSDTIKIRTDYYAERDRIKSLPSTKTTRALSSAALKAYTAAIKKSAADYKASQPAALAVRDGANKAAVTARDAAIAKAKASYGTFIESIGYGVLIP